MKNNLTIEQQVSKMPDYMLQTKVNGQISNENNDASLVAITSIILAVSSFILSASWLKYIIIAGGIVMMIQFILASINIYSRFHPKYTVGNSYVTRKLLTAATPYYLYSLVIPYIIYDKGLFWIVIFFLPYLFCSPIINSFWRSLDILKYADIDRQLPLQKRSYFETEEQTYMYYLCHLELAERELKRNKEIGKNIEDIEIFRKAKQ